MEVRRGAGTYVVIVVCMAVTFGLGGYVAGRASIDADAVYEQGWTGGEAAARNAAIAREGRRREAIERAAFDRGQAHGARLGRRAGLRAGRREGFRRGEQRVFAGFPDGWRPGRWYGVRIAQGEGLRGYSIAERIALDPGRVFRLCGARVCSAGAPRRVRTATAPAVATTGGTRAPADPR